MKRTSMYTAVLALSLAMALAGGGLACRTFRERLDALEEQAVLQHQRNVCGLEDAFAAEYDTRSGAGYLSSGADSVCARVGQAYTRGQWLILGSSTAAFALLREGDVAYSALPESVAAADVQQAAAATDGILLRGETLLLGGVLNTPYSYPVAVVTAADASEAFAARNRLLYSWLAVQAVITLAALVAAYHYERLQELNARQSRFVADLTHELKTPLTSLIGYADLLRGGTLDAERRRTAAEALYHESARLESLSQQLLALNGLQADGVVLRPVRVAAAFADAVRSLPDVVLDCDAPAEAVVLADRVLLADLVRNLALNAWHAGPQDGAVHLRCTDAGECWRLTVQDTGCGIPAEALPHLTEPFYRVDKARARANGGSGVGLALCAQIAEAFGTQMTFASRVGEGTTVTILLQKEAEHEEAAQQQLNFKIAAVSLALLALPPLAVYGQTVRCRAAQPRPALPGVMSDEIRLDPVAGALYRYGVQGGINRADSYWSDNVFTVLRGKLKQAAARGLLSREQLDYLLDRVAEGEAHAGPVQPENGSVQVQCYGCSYTGNIQTVSFRMYTVNAYKVTESGEMYSIDDETSIELMYLPGNGAFLQVGVLDNRLPAAESTPEEQVQAFLTQLDTTLDGSWEQTTTEDGLEYKHTSGVLRVVRYAPDEVDFALCVTLDPDVYGGLDTLSNVVIGPDGTIYTPGGEYGTF